MTLYKWLRNSEKVLLSANITTARLDCLVLLQDTLQRDKSWILAHTDYRLSEEHIILLNAQINRRKQHEPLAYIRGKSEFYGREFKVSADTLQPRPETETMIELLLDQVKNGGLIVKSIIDVGTGSGCIAITLACELPDVRVVGADISKKCIRIAEQNAEKHGVESNFYEGNLLNGIPSSFFHQPYCVVANLPYVPNSFTINEAAMYEPELAIFGGDDGLDYYRELFTSLPEKKPVHVFTESLPTQHLELQNIANAAGYKESVREDFIQLFQPIE